jgi:hypothetical protein
MFSDWDTSAPFWEYFTFTPGAHATSLLSGFLTPKCVPLSLTVYRGTYHQQSTRRRGTLNLYQPVPGLNDSSLHQTRGSSFFGDSLATHVKKGISERALQGRHLGGIPFGYQSCRENKQLVCEPEHPGGVHLDTEEAKAVQELFRRYASGTTTLSQLAVWMNTQGFRISNMHHKEHAPAL